MTEPLSTWLQFLSTQGARLSEPPGLDVIGFSDTGAGHDGIVAPLTDLGLIAASGEEAARFLHGQLTNDVEHLDRSEARLAGYCTAKGRLLATMLIWKTADAIMLQLPRPLQPAIQKRLQMYLLRAKAKLTDVSDSNVILGLAGRAAENILPEWFDALPAAPYAKTESRAGTLTRLADADGMPRYQWITVPETARQAWPRLTEVLRPAGTGAWRLLEIHAGIPQITQATLEQFVPQMINYEAIGGVNFKKGCYPGQEIVARSQYLGKLKRRMVLATTDAPEARAGMEVFSAGDPEQPCGMVVNAEPGPAGRIDCLVEIKTAVLEEGSIHLGSATGPSLQVQALPYSLPEPA